MGEIHRGWLLRVRQESHSTPDPRECARVGHGSDWLGWLIQVLVVPASKPCATEIPAVRSPGVFLSVLGSAQPLLGVIQEEPIEFCQGSTALLQSQPTVDAGTAMALRASGLTWRPPARLRGSLPRGAKASHSQAAYVSSCRVHGSSTQNCTVGHSSSGRASGSADLRTKSAVLTPMRNLKRLVLGHLGRNALVSSLGGERTFISFAVRYTLTQADSSWSGIICLVRNTISRAALASAVLQEHFSIRIPIKPSKTAA